MTKKRDEDKGGFDSAKQRRWFFATHDDKKAKDKPKPKAKPSAKKRHYLPDSDTMSSLALGHIKRTHEKYLPKGKTPPKAAQQRVMSMFAINNKQMAERRQVHEAKKGILSQENKTINDTSLPAKTRLAALERRIERLRKLKDEPGLVGKGATADYKDAMSLAKKLKK